MTKESQVAPAKSIKADPVVAVKVLKSKESPATQTSEELKQPQKEKKKGPKGIVIVFPDWCKACGICVYYCPTDTIASAPDGKTIVQNPETCIGCMQCDYRCPDFAITVKPINGGDN